MCNAVEFRGPERAQALSARLGQALLALGAKASACESCTAGAVADAMSWAPGASGWFEGGLVCYSEAAKSRLAGVDPSLFAGPGVVSSEVALAMAEGACRATGARFAVATTGLAGPGGSTSPRGAELPEGLVCIAVYDALTHASKLKAEVFAGPRSAVRHAASERAMQMLLDLAESARRAP